MDRKIILVLTLFLLVLAMPFTLFADKLNDLGLDSNGKPVIIEKAKPQGLTAVMETSKGMVTINRQDIKLSRDTSLRDKAAAIVEVLLEGPAPDLVDEGVENVFPPGTELAEMEIDDNNYIRIYLEFPETFISDPGNVANGFDAIVRSLIRSLQQLDLVGYEVMALDPESGDFKSFDNFLPEDSFSGPETAPDSAVAPPQEKSERSQTRDFPHIGSEKPTGALTGKAVYMNPGHGWYWTDSDYWALQRGFVHNNIEDYSNVDTINHWLAAYCYNAGADVFSVRELDPNTNMVIVDNDDGSPDYIETGTWITSSLDGFENGHTPYLNGEDPFSFGTNRLATCSTGAPTATATYIPTIPEAGWYNVYVSHGAYTNRSPQAHYTVYHAGGQTDVRIDQRRRRFTWILLGKFYYEAGRNPATGQVVLSNDSTSTSHYISADAVRFGGGMGLVSRGTAGVSGYPRFIEDARYNTHFSGYDDYDVVGSHDMADGWSRRPRYGRWLKEGGTAYGAPAEDSVFVSSHTNAFNGSVVGLGTFVYTGYEGTWHDDFRDFIHDEVYNDLHNGYSTSFVNHGTGKKYGTYGENNPSNVGDLMPILLGEWIFHDAAADMALYHDPKFKMMLGRAVYQGIVKFWDDRNATSSSLLPESPRSFKVIQTSTTAVQLTWAAPLTDGSDINGDAATGYKLYQSSHGRGFPAGSALGNITTTSIGSLTPGQTYYFRLSATNSGGESFPTETLAVKMAYDVGTPKMLLVSGFDKLDTSTRVAIPNYSGGLTLYRQILHEMNTRDYIVEHAAAIDNYPYQVCFDSCEHDTVGTVTLSNYDAVIWVGGIQAEVSTSDPTVDTSIDSTKQSQLTSYLGAGGKLFVSGSEIAWDLDRGGGTTFVDNTLKANYVSDDAATYSAEGSTGSIFDGVSSINFDDGTGATYNVQWPDVLSASGGSTAALEYGSGGSTSLDSYDAIGSWQDPNYSGQTTADAASTFTISTSTVHEGSGSGDLYYVWGAGSFIREYNSGLPEFTADSVLTLWVYGDGSGHDLRICLRDSDNDLFVNNYTTLSFTGWQQITWDIQNDPRTLWVGSGDGSLTGPNVRYDSIQVNKVSGVNSGNIYLDDARYLPNSGPSGDVAAVQYSGTYDLVYMGFPFETITSSAVRDDVMERILDFFGFNSTIIDSWLEY